MNKRTIFAMVAALVTALAIFAYYGTSQAADLGGNCCADLEERIAELEATTVRKNNRKVTLEVYGQVNAGLLYLDAGGYSNTQVVNNGNDESRLGFAGEALITPTLKAGFVMEFGLDQLGLLDSGVTSFQPTVRRSYWYLSSKDIGTISMGKLGQATQDFDRISPANTAVVARPYSLGAVSDTYLTGIDVPFDGHYKNAVRLDSAKWNGFRASASWGASKDATSSDGNGNTWDVALTYGDDWKDFVVVGGIGYRHDTDLDINVLNMVSLSLPTGDVNTFLATGGLKHKTTGLFMNLSYADQDWKDANFKLKGWSAMGGMEYKWNSLGATTFYGEWAKMTFDAGTNYDAPYWGLGAVQNFENVGMDIYAGYRQYNLSDFNAPDVKTLMVGTRFKF